MNKCACPYRYDAKKEQGPLSISNRFLTSSPQPVMAFQYPSRGGSKERSMEKNLFRSKGCRSPIFNSKEKRCFDSLSQKRILLMKSLVR